MSSMIRSIFLLFILIVSINASHCNTSRIYDMSLTHIQDQILNIPFSQFFSYPMDANRNTLEYRLAMVEHFKEVIGLSFDAYNPGFQQVLTSDNKPVFLFPGKLPDELLYQVYAFDNQQVLGADKNKFPVTNLDIKDTYFGLSFPQGGKVFGTYGGKYGRDLGPNDGFAYGRYHMIDLSTGNDLTHITYKSKVPVGGSPHTGALAITCYIEHPVWGDGITNGYALYTPVGDIHTGQTRAEVYNFMHFPTNLDLAEPNPNKQCNNVDVDHLFN